MSYDLYFRSETTVQPRELESYFAARQHYTQNVAQAWYENEDTGVYFSFEWGDALDEVEVPCVAAFNINFFRPSYFILEAEPEVTAFVQAFGLAVEDPQEVMLDGVFDADGMKAGWDHGNRCSFGTLADEPDMETPATLPSAALLSAWSWNLDRASLQSVLGESCWVPAVWFWRLDGEVVTAALWPDGIPIAVPPVDYLAVFRRKLAPRKRLKRSEDFTFVTLSEVAPLLDSHGTSRADGLFVLDYASPPSDIVSFITALAPEGRPFDQLPPDQVLDRELVV